MDYRSRSRPPRGEYSPRNERDDYFQPTFDFNNRNRSRSAEYRRDWSDEDDFERERDRFRSSQPQLARNEYAREREIDSPRRERDYFHTMKRGAEGRREVARSQEWYPSPRGERVQERWQPPSPNELRYKARGPGRVDGRSEGRSEYGQKQLPRHPANLSPVSQGSAPRPLKIQTARQPQQKGFFGQRKEQSDESPRSIGYPPPRNSYREAPRFRYDGRGMELQPAPRDYTGGAQSGGYSRSYQSYHQSHQSGGGGFSSGRRALTMQPGPQTQSWKYQGNATQGPRQYHRVHCGCFSFTWPPWSVQPAPPPQPRYPNIP